MTTSDDIDALLEAVLKRAGEPLNVIAVLKAMPAGKKPAKGDAQRRLTQLVKEGRIHRWPGKTEKFAAVSAQSLARDQILRALSSGPLTEAEIKKRAGKAVQSLVKANLAALVGERAVLKHPKLGKRVPFGVGRPNAADYLPAEMALAFVKLKRIGFSEAELQAALHLYAGGIDGQPRVDENSDKAILDAMSQLNSQASRGALVYMTDLRSAVAWIFHDKASFDRAVVDLATRGKVQLQSHPWPDRLTDQEKAALVPNGHGGFFDAIGLRME